MADAGDDDDWVARCDPDAVVNLASVSPPRRDSDDEDQDAPCMRMSNKRPRAAEDRAVLGDQCPICLADLADPVMIRDCFHVYCYDCLSMWTRNLVLHGVRTPSCPLCKRSFHTALADVVSETEFTELRFGLSQGKRRRCIQDDGDSYRSMVYRRRLRLVSVNGVDVGDTPPQEMVPVKTASRAYMPWLKRELRACIGADVDLTVLIALIECEIGSPVKKTIDWKALEATLAPFLQDDVIVFIRECASFLASRLNMQAYDAAIVYCCPQDRDHATPCCSVCSQAAGDE